MAVRRWDPFRDLPGCDVGQIEASMSDGLLTIEVAKAAQARPVRVEVKAGPGSPGGGEMSGSPLGKERG